MAKLPKSAKRQKKKINFLKRLSIFCPEHSTALKICLTLTYYIVINALLWHRHWWHYVTSQSTATMWQQKWVVLQNTYQSITFAKTSTHLFQPWSSPVLFLLIEVAHNVQQTANEGVGRCRAGGALARGLSSKHGTAPLCVGKLLLHLHILLPEQGQVLLQLGHLLCPTSK